MQAVDWSPEFAARIAPAFKAQGMVSYYRDQVISGMASCWEVGGLVLVLRQERDHEDNPVLVICGAAGEGLKDAIPAIRQAAKTWGYQSVRFHTEHESLVRLVAEVEPQPVEYVVKVAV